MEQKSLESPLFLCYLTYWLLHQSYADVAELADALDLGSSVHDVRVQVPPSAVLT